MMKPRYLALALAAAMAGTSAFAQVAPHVPGEAPSPRLLAPQDLSSALTAPQTMRSTPDASSAQALVWVERADLATASVRQRVVDALARKRAVLVTGSSEDDQGEMETFGFRAPGVASIYRRSSNGAIDVITADADLPAHEAAEAFTEWLGRQKPLSEVDHPRTRSLVQNGTVDDGEYTPRIEIHQDRIFPGRRAVRHHIVVLRDIDAQRDEKVVMVTTEVDQVPSLVGAMWNGTALAEGKGYHLIVPGRYIVTTQLAGVDQPVPLTLQDYAPKSDGATERLINDTVSIKTTSGASATFDVLNGLAHNNAPHLGKVALGFNYAKEHLEQRSVTMSLKDYFVQASPRSGKGTRAMDWTFPLASDIAHSVDYFADGENFYGAVNSTRRMTPMMRQATLQVGSVWRVPGSYEGSLDVITRATVELRVYDSLEKSIDSGPDDAESDMAFTTRINLGSAHLTRQPTVRLQSLHGQGQCLAQPVSNAPDVVLESCEKGEGGKAQQWYLEVDNTYRNRGSGQCLTTAPHSGRIHAADCAGASLTQQWQWSADRIHSLYMGGNTWRLHLRDGIVNAMFDPQRHQMMVSNQYHPLLRPWSSYPNRPSKGDVVPNLSSVSPPIPDSYLGYDAVGTEERWQPLPIRFGL